MGTTYVHIGCNENDIGILFILLNLQPLSVVRAENMEKNMRSVLSNVYCKLERSYVNDSLIFLIGWSALAQQSYVTSLY